MAKVRLPKDHRHVLTVVSKHPDGLDEAGMCNQTGHINAVMTGDDLVKRGLLVKTDGRYLVTEQGEEAL